MAGGGGWGRGRAGEGAVEKCWNLVDAGTTQDRNRTKKVNLRSCLQHLEERSVWALGSLSKEWKVRCWDLLSSVYHRGLIRPTLTKRFSGISTIPPALGTRLGPSCLPCLSPPPPPLPF